MIRYFDKLSVSILLIRMVLGITIALLVSNCGSTVDTIKIDVEDIASRKSQS